MNISEQDGGVVTVKCQGTSETHWPKPSHFIEEETEVPRSRPNRPGHLAIYGQIRTQDSWLLVQLAFWVCVFMKNENDQRRASVKCIVYRWSRRSVLASH